MSRLVLVLLVSLSLNVSADETGDDSELSTSALDPRITPYISPNASSSAEKGFLEENKIAIGAIMKSRHFDKDKYDYHDYNEDHEGVYLSINRWSTGTFINSADERSVFVTYNPEMYQNRSFMVKLVTGLANGYDGWENAQGDYLVILGVSAQWSFLKTMLSYDSVTFGMELPLN